MIDTGLEYKVLTKSGAWYFYGNERLGQGRENVREWLKENPAAAREIEFKIRKVSGIAVEKDKSAAVETKLESEN